MSIPFSVANSRMVIPSEPDTWAPLIVTDTLDIANDNKSYIFFIEVFIEVVKHLNFPIATPCKFSTLSPRIVLSDLTQRKTLTLWKHIPLLALNR